MALDSGIPSQDLRVDATAAELRGNKQGAAIIRDVASNRQSTASGRRGDPTKRQVDIKPTSDTIESLGKVEFRTSDFKRDNFNKDKLLVFPDKLHNGNVPYIKFDIYEINSNPAATVTGTVSNRSQASIEAGLRVAGKAAFSAASIAAEKAGEVARNLLGDTISDATVKAATAATEVGATTARQAGINPEQLKERVASLFEDFSLSRYSDTLVKSIALPIPDGLQTQYAQDYSDISLTSAFGIVGFAAQALAEPKFMDRGDPYLTEIASSLAKGAFNTSEELTNILTFGSSGRVVNPQMEMLYRSPQFREFNFDFRLLPRNPFDAQKIYDIIKELKLRSSPTFCGTTTGRYYVPPARFAFSFFNTNGTENEFLFRSKQCVVTNISVDYAPNGYATHSDGVPVEIRMQLQLRETAMITAEDIMESYY